MIIQGKTKFCPRSLSFSPHSTYHVSDRMFVFNIKDMNILSKYMWHDETTSYTKTAP